MKEIIESLKQWLEKANWKHGYNIKEGSKQFSVQWKVVPVNKNEPEWFKDYRTGQNSIHNQMIESLKDSTTVVKEIVVKVDNLAISFATDSCSL